MKKDDFTDRMKILKELNQEVRTTIDQKEETKKEKSLWSNFK